MIESNLAILIKGNYLALVAMKSGMNGGEVLSLIPPLQPKLGSYPNFFEVVQHFDDIVETCIDDEWKLVHIGEPNYG